MQVVGYAALQIIPSMRGTTRALENEINGAMPGIGDRAGQSLGSRLFDGIQTWAQRGVLAVGAIATAVGAMAVRGGITRALDTEDAIIQMRRMGLETEQVNFLVDQVDQTFDGSIFSNPAGFKLAGLLHGTQVDLERIPGVMGTIADFAAHGNVPLEQMSDIFLQVIGSGKVSATTFNRLTAAGVPLSQIADSLGMTTVEMRELATEGGFTADMFLEAAAGAEMFQGAAKSAGDGTRGAFSNTLTQVKVLGQRLVNPIFGENGPMVTFFKATREALIGVRPLFDTLGASLASVLIPALATATEWLGRLPGLLDRLFSGGVRELPGAAMLSELLVILNPLGAVLRGVLPSLSEMGATLTMVGQAIGGVLVDLLPIVAQGFVDLATAVGGSLVSILPVVADVLSILAGMFTELAPAIGDVLPVIADLAVMAVNLVTPLLANEDVLWALIAAFVVWKAAVAGVALTGLITSLVRTAAAFTTKTAAMLASKAQTVALAAMYAGDFVRSLALGTAALVRNAAQWVASATVQAVQAARMQLAWTVGFIRPAIQATGVMVAQVARQVAAWVLLGGQATLNAVKAAAAWATGVIVPAAAATGAMVAQVARQVAAWVLLGTQSLIGAAKVAAAWVISMGPIGLVIAAVVGLVALIVSNWDAIVSWTKEAWGNLTSWLSDLWNSITETAANIWNGIVDFFKAIPGKIVQFFLNWTLLGLLIKHWDSIKTTAVNAWNNLINWVKEIPGRIVQFFLNWTLLGLLIQHWDSIKATAVEKWNSLVEWVKGIPGRFLDGLRAIGNLAGDMAAWVLGVKDAALEKWNELVDWVKGVPGMILDGLGNVGTMLLDAGRRIMEGLWNGLKEKWEDVKNFVGGIGDWIAEHKGPKAYDLALLRPAGNWIMSGLQNSLKDGIPGLRATLGDITSEFDALTGVEATLDAVRPVVQRPTPASAAAWGTANSNNDGPRELVIVDANGDLIGRMRVEAGKVATGKVTPFTEGRAAW